MKKIALLAFLAACFAACEKFDMRHPFKKEQKEKPCPTVNKESIPETVLITFKNKYPNVSGEKWFSTNDQNYYATFVLNDMKTLVEIDNTGTFVKEEIGNSQQGEHQDNNSHDNKCSCEIEEGD